MNDDLDKQIKERLQSIFPDPATAASVVDLVVHAKKPRGWHRKSNAPYYKEVYALQIKRDIDRMIADEGRSSITYRYAIWCGEDSNMSPKTLYARINQAVRYLVERLDTPDKRYAKWHDSVRVESKQKIGIVISYAPTDNYVAEMSVSREMAPLWKQKMDHWLESDECKPFIQEGLLLSPEEIKAIKEELGQLSFVQASITSSTIKIVKMNV